MSTHRAIHSRRHVTTKACRCEPPVASIVEPLEPRRMLAAAGALDTTFSGDGKATVSLSLNAADVAVQADGKTVVVGTHTNSSTGDTQFAVVRFNIDGTLDNTFSGGIVTTQLSNAGESDAEAVAIAPDGKIVVVGTALVVDSGFNEPELAVARYNTDGSLDNSFDDNGVLSMDLGDFASWTYGFDVAVQPDGMMVIVGETYKAPDPDFFIIRLAPNGQRDGTFDDDGRRFVGLGGDDGAIAVKLAVNGQILVTGHVETGSNPTEFRRTVGTIRLNADGFLDGNYGGGDGSVGFALPGRAITTVADLIVLPDGKVVIAGNSPGLTGQQDFFVARFTAAGVLDTSFGELSGFTVTDLGSDDVVAGMTATPTGGGGGFIVSGRSGGTMAAVKYTDNGAVDTTFGTGGIVRISGFGGVANIAPGPGRRVMLAGGSGFATARLLLSGANIVTAGVVDNLAIEGTTNTASFFVGRTERLPFRTKVFFSVTGTASFGNTRGGVRDYGMPGLIFPTGGTPYVEIPENETFVILTLTTVNDTLQEGNESATFTPLSNSNYEIGTPSGGSITIRDDDVPNNNVGTTTVTKPPKKVEVGQEVLSAVTWTVPTGDWRQLSSIQLRLRDQNDDDALALLTFDEQTRTFSLDSTAAASYGPVSLVVEKCTFAAAGPTAPAVTVTFTFRFNAAAAGRHFALDVSADNDAGAFSGFSQVGKIHVRKKIKQGVTSIDSSGTVIGGTPEALRSVVSGNGGDGIVITGQDQDTGKVWSQGDFNHGGGVEVADLGILASNWQANLSRAPAARHGASTSRRAAARPFDVIEELSGVLRS